LAPDAAFLEFTLNAKYKQLEHFWSQHRLKLYGKQSQFIIEAFTREDGQASPDDEPWNHKEAKNRLVPGSMPNFEEALFVSNQVKTALS